MLKSSGPEIKINNPFSHLFKSIVIGILVLVSGILSLLMFNYFNDEKEVDAATSSVYFAVAQYRYGTGALATPKVGLYGTGALTSNAVVSNVRVFVSTNVGSTIIDDMEYYNYNFMATNYRVYLYKVTNFSSTTQIQISYTNPITHSDYIDYSSTYSSCNYLMEYTNLIYLMGYNADEDEMFNCSYHDGYEYDSSSGSKTELSTSGSISHSVSTSDNKKTQTFVFKPASASEYICSTASSEPTSFSALASSGIPVMFVTYRVQDVLRGDGVRMTYGDRIYQKVSSEQRDSDGNVIAKPTGADAFPDESFGSSSTFFLYWPAINTYGSTTFSVTWSPTLPSGTKYKDNKVYIEVSSTSYEASCGEFTIQLLYDTWTGAKAYYSAYFMDDDDGGICTVPLYTPIIFYEILSYQDLYFAVAQYKDNSAGTGVLANHSVTVSSGTLTTVNTFSSATLSTIADSSYLNYHVMGNRYTIKLYKVTNATPSSYVTISYTNVFSHNEYISYSSTYANCDYLMEYTNLIIGFSEDADGMQLASYHNGNFYLTEEYDSYVDVTLSASGVGHTVSTVSGKYKQEFQFNVSPQDKVCATASSAPTSFSALASSGIPAMFVTYAAEDVINEDGLMTPNDRIYQRVSSEQRDASGNVLARPTGEDAFPNERLGAGDSTFFVYWGAVGMGEAYNIKWEPSLPSGKARLTNSPVHVVMNGVDEVTSGSTIGVSLSKFPWSTSSDVSYYEITFWTSIFSNTALLTKPVLFYEVLEDSGYDVTISLDFAVGHDGWGGAGRASSTIFGFNGQTGFHAGPYSAEEVTYSKGLKATGNTLYLYSLPYASDYLEVKVTAATTYTYYFANEGNSYLTNAYVTRTNSSSSPENYGFKIYKLTSSVASWTFSANTTGTNKVEVIVHTFSWEDLARAAYNSVTSATGMASKLTTNNGYYAIEDPLDLGTFACFADSATAYNGYIATANKVLNLSGYRVPSMTQFSGTLDGDNNVITGYRMTAINQPLVVTLNSGGKLTGIYLKDPITNNEANYGPIQKAYNVAVSYGATLCYNLNSGATVEYCGLYTTTALKITAYSTSYHTLYGGLVGVCNGKVYSCSTDFGVQDPYTTSASGSSKAIRIGGLVAELNGGADIKYSYSVLNSCSSNHTMSYGGIGANTNATSSSKATITQVYAATANASKPSSFSVYSVGMNAYSSVLTISYFYHSLYYGTSTAGTQMTDSNTLGTSRTRAQMQSSSNFSGFSFNTIWYMDSSDIGWHGTDASPSCGKKYNQYNRKYPVIVNGGIDMGELTTDDIHYYVNGTEITTTSSSAKIFKNIRGTFVLLVTNVNSTSLQVCNTSGLTAVKGSTITAKINRNSSNSYMRLTNVKYGTTSSSNLTITPNTGTASTDMGTLAYDNTVTLFSVTLTNFGASSQDLHIYLETPQIINTESKTPSNTCTPTDSVMSNNISTSPYYISSSTYGGYTSYYVLATSSFVYNVSHSSTNYKYKTIYVSYDETKGPSVTIFDTSTFKYTSASSGTVIQFSTYSEIAAHKELVNSSTTAPTSTLSADTNNFVRINTITAGNSIENCIKVGFADPHYRVQVNKPDQSNFTLSLNTSGGTELTSVTSGSGSDATVYVGYNDFKDCKINVVDSNTAYKLNQLDFGNVSVFKSSDYSALYDGYATGTGTGPKTFTYTNSNGNTGTLAFGGSNIYSGASKNIGTPNPIIIKMTSAQSTVAVTFKYITGSSLGTKPASGSGFKIYASSGSTTSELNSSNTSATLNLVIGSSITFTIKNASGGTLSSTSDAFHDSTIYTLGSNKYRFVVKEADTSTIKVQNSSTSFTATTPSAAKTYNVYTIQQMQITHETSDTAIYHSSYYSTAWQDAGARCTYYITTTAGSGFSGTRTTKSSTEWNRTSSLYVDYGSSITHSVNATGTVTVKNASINKSDLFTINNTTIGTTSVGNNTATAITGHTKITPSITINTRKILVSVENKNSTMQGYRPKITAYNSSGTAIVSETQLSTSGGSGTYSSTNVYVYTASQTDGVYTYTITTAYGNPFRFYRGDTSTTVVADKKRLVSIGDGMLRSSGTTVATATSGTFNGRTEPIYIEGTVCTTEAQGAIVFTYAPYVTVSLAPTITRHSMQATYNTSIKGVTSVVVTAYSGKASGTTYTTSGSLDSTYIVKTDTTNYQYTYDLSNTTSSSQIILKVVVTLDAGFQLNSWKVNGTDQAVTAYSNGAWKLADNGLTLWVAMDQTDFDTDNEAFFSTSYYPQVEERQVYNNNAKYEFVGLGSLTIVDKWSSYSNTLVDNATATSFTGTWTKGNYSAWYYTILYATATPRTTSYFCTKWFYYLTTSGTQSHVVALGSTPLTSAKTSDGVAMSSYASSKPEFKFHIEFVAQNAASSGTITGQTISSSSSTPGTLATCSVATNTLGTTSLGWNYTNINSNYSVKYYTLEIMNRGSSTVLNTYYLMPGSSKMYTNTTFTDSVNYKHMTDGTGTGNWKTWGTFNCTAITNGVTVTFKGASKVSGVTGTNLIEDTYSNFFSQAYTFKLSVCLVENVSTISVSTSSKATAFNSGAQAQYIRLYGSTNNATYYPTVYATNFNGKLSSTSSTGSESVRNGGTLVKYNYYQFSLGSVGIIKKIVIPYNSGCTYDSIYLSSDGNNWYTVYDKYTDGAYSSNMTIDFVADSGLNISTFMQNSAFSGTSVTPTISSLIPIVAGKTYGISNNLSSYSISKITFYGANFEAISATTNAYSLSSKNVYYTATAPSGASYIGISLTRTSGTAQASEITSDLGLQIYSAQGVSLKGNNGSSDYQAVEFLVGASSKRVDDIRIATPMDCYVSEASVSGNKSEIDYITANKAVESKYYTQMGNDYKITVNTVSLNAKPTQAAVDSIISNITHTSIGLSLIHI